MKFIQTEKKLFLPIGKIFTPMGTTHCNTGSVFGDHHLFVCVHCTATSNEPIKYLLSQADKNSIKNFNMYEIIP